ncbi:hypothetical protein GIS00_12310 [Nakamurella sp. YIM 132087]|uniref:DUF6924 domain-containing protein n=1 Tax=Nakamurella alba TaxID=2665158 RepID=A0A7K1FPH3_9ACTN|nr:hypothetical protein [Nakamurella alba]MTD14724.1 hypothetical protein [Nakamurella alba]
MEQTVEGLGEPFAANIEYVSERRFEGLTAGDLVPETLWSEESDVLPDPTHVFLADLLALTDPEPTVLVVDRLEEPGRSFRALPSEVFGIQANLAIGNMMFNEFADYADDSGGVFRGFDDHV